ncbi:sensor histidine kinase [Tenacibaculum singaporense]|uniref:histidine kinase n=1 Tax=Tenacibaculum singaporense TaxID=2358479 RepID=A0A3Q8RM71_9FLAO|nr:HAMP domain-containing sensor histidine kinase [Tenacibaculum singaporense]AZJ35092.1 sensor histidine kinase [Tenacibaculum singaporense]
MRSASTTEKELKERIKELTCLYEVTSLIINANLDQVDVTLKAIAKSLKRALQFPKNTQVFIDTEKYSEEESKTEEELCIISSPIPVFNIPKGKISAFIKGKELKDNLYLKEEKELFDTVAIKIGGLLERIEIKNNELSMRRKMEHADRLSILGELTAGIAHELNTPLANILGYSELLKADMSSNEKALADVDKIIQSAIFSREVVKKLMYFACEMPQEMKKVNIIPSIKDAINLLDATFRRQSVKYLVKVEESELWLRADTVQLTQIIFNLIINAIYFSPKEGLVTIETFQTDKEVILRISDEGIGLSDEALEKVFQPFFTTKPTGEGTGLGLSVVHGIVSSHKGTITAKNGIEKGAIFEVRLPK